MDSSAKAFLFDLLSTPSPTGFETAGQKKWLEYVRPFARTVEHDAYGSAWATQPGKGKAPLKLMLEASAKYLVGQERNLNIEIDLPNGKVRLHAVGRRYKKVGLHVSTERFSIGAQIISFVDGGEERYIDFLTNGRRARKVAGKLELGID